MLKGITDKATTAASEAASTTYEAVAELVEDVAEYEANLDHQYRKDRLVKIAWFLDSCMRIPFTEIRFGVDDVVGLVPIAGGIMTFASSAYIIYEGVRFKIPLWALSKMAGNSAIDIAFGFVPVIGDAFDVWFKSNKRNVNIILEELNK